MEARRRETELLLQKEIENGRLLIDRVNEGDENGARELLSSGVQPNADAYNRTLYYKSKNYWSPLHYAARNGHHEIVNLLIAHGGTLFKA